MRGALPIKAGTYHITDAVDLQFALCDAGTVIRLNYLPIGNGCTIIIDETGKVVHREAYEDQKFKKASTASPAMPSDTAVKSPLPAVGPATQATTPEKHSAKPAKPKTRAPKRIRFILQYGLKSRVRSRAFVLGGFMDGHDMSILYRVAGGGTIYYEGQLLINGDSVIRGDHIPEDQRLPRQYWDRFLAEPENENFRLSILTRVWRKMAHDEIRQAIEGKTLKLKDDG
jgi:hypothetical protein